MFEPFGKTREERRAQAVLQLQALRLGGGGSGFELNGADMEVMDQSETVSHEDRRTETYYLTQVVRNPAGDYFLLKTTDGKPFVKYLPPERARLVLKSKYREKGQP